MSRNSNVHVATFSRCTTRNIADHVKRLLRRKPDEVVIHVWTNSLKSDESPRGCAIETVDLVRSVDNSTSDTMVTISSLVTRGVLCGGGWVGMTPSYFGELVSKTLVCW